MWPSSQYVCTQVNTFHDGCRLNKWNTKLVSVNCTTICNFNFKVAQPEFIWPPKLPPLATIWQLRRECKTLHIHTHENNWQGSTLVWHKYICTKWMFETYNPKPWMVDPNCNWDDILVRCMCLRSSTWGGKHSFVQCLQNCSAWWPQTAHLVTRLQAIPDTLGGAEGISHYHTDMMPHNQPASIHDLHAVI